jgi:hypothetical protein
MSQPFHLNKNTASPSSIDAQKGISQKGINDSKSPLHFQGKTVPNTVSMDSEDKLDFSQTSASSQKKGHDQKFSLLQAGKKFLHGIISPVTVFFEHPVMAFGGLAAGIAACTLIPEVLPLMTIGFGAYSLYQIGKGAINSIQRYRAGDYTGAENAFEEMGAGTIGTALSALGVRATATAAAEAKAANAAVQAGKSAEQIAEATALAAKEVKGMTFLEALKENATILTKSEGRQALLKGFKPSSIQKRFQDTVAYFKKSAFDKVKTQSYTEEALFAKSAEGLRRAKMTKAEVQSEAEAVLAKAFDELGIPKELRPKFNIQDELRFLDKSEIEAMAHKAVQERHYAASPEYLLLDKKELPKPVIFQEGETPTQFTNAQIVEKVKAAVANVYDTMGVPKSSQHLENLTLGDAHYIGGNFNPKAYEINMHANTYRSGKMTLEQVLGHEPIHTQQALLRAQLSPAEASAILQEELLNGVRLGESEEIVLRGNLLGNTMMKPPKFSKVPDLKEKIITLIRDEVYPNVDSHTQYWSDLAWSGFKSIEGANPPPSIQKIQSKLTQWVQENPKFLENYQGDPKAAVNHLLEYLEAHANRFKAFSNPEITNPEILAHIKKMPFTDAEKAKAVQSLRDRIGLIDGNCRNQGFLSHFGDSGAFNQYQFSAEEVLARNSAAKFEKAQIQGQLQQKPGTPPMTGEAREVLTTRLAELDLELKRNDLGQKMYQAYTQHINHPEDASLLKTFEGMKKEYEVMKAQMDAQAEKFNAKRRFEVVQEPFPIRNGAVIRGGDDSDGKNSP